MTSIELVSLAALIGYLISYLVDWIDIRFIVKHSGGTMTTGNFCKDPGVAEKEVS